MPKHNNSASRLVTLLRSIPGHADNTQTLAVWADLFSISEPNTNKKSVLVAERLQAMYRELEFVQVQMQKAGFSEHLYSSAVSKVEHTISAMLLPNPWNQARQYLTTETLVALEFCSEILPDEESQIAPEELEEIKALVDELAGLLAQSQLPHRLKKLIEHHINLIRHALAEYPISGAKVLREASQAALGELLEAKEDVKANHNAPEVNKLGKVWKRLNEVTNAALKVDQLAQLGAKAWAMLENLL